MSNGVDRNMSNGVNRGIDPRLLLAYQDDHYKRITLNYNNQYLALHNNVALQNNVAVALQNNVAVALQNNVAVALQHNNVAVSDLNENNAEQMIIEVVEEMPGYENYYSARDMRTERSLNDVVSEAVKSDREQQQQHQQQQYVRYGARDMRTERSMNEVVSDANKTERERQYAGYSARDMRTERSMSEAVKADQEIRQYGGYSARDMRTDRSMNEAVMRPDNRAMNEAVMRNERSMSEAVMRNERSMNEAAMRHDRSMNEAIMRTERSMNDHMRGDSRSMNEASRSMSEAVMRSDNRSMNEVVMRSDNRSMNDAVMRSDNRSMNDAIMRSDTRSITEPIMRTDSRSITDPIMRTDTRSINDPLMRTDNRSMNDAIMRSETRSIIDPIMRTDNRSMNEAVMRTDNRSMNEAVMRTDNRSMNEAIMRPDNRSMNEAVMRPDNRSMNEAVMRPDNRSMNEAVMRPDNRSMNESVMRPDNRSMNEAVMRTDNRSMNEVVMRTDNRSMTEAVSKAVTADQEISQYARYGGAPRDMRTERSLNDLVTEAVAPDDSEMDQYTTELENEIRTMETNSSLPCREEEYETTETATTTSATAESTEESVDPLLMCDLDTKYEECIVEGCSSRKQEIGGPCMFKYPSTEEMRPKWEKVCPLPDDVGSIHRALVCEKHFLPSDFDEFPDDVYLIASEDKKLLKRDAVPSQNLGSKKHLKGDDTQQALQELNKPKRKYRTKKEIAESEEGGGPSKRGRKKQVVIKPPKAKFENIAPAYCKADCTRQCEEHVDRKTQKRIYKYFKSLADDIERRKFITKSFNFFKAAVPNPTDRRFHFMVDNQRIEVCEQFFRECLGLSEILLNKYIYGQYPIEEVAPTDKHPLMKTFQKLSEKLPNFSNPLIGAPVAAEKPATNAETPNTVQSFIEENFLGIAFEKCTKSENEASSAKRPVVNMFLIDSEVTLDSHNLWQLNGVFDPVLGNIPDVATKAKLTYCDGKKRTLATPVNIFKRRIVKNKKEQNKKDKGVQTNAGLATRQAASVAPDYEDNPLANYFTTQDMTALQTLLYEALNSDSTSVSQDQIYKLQTLVDGMLLSTKEGVSQKRSVAKNTPVTRKSASKMTISKKVTAENKRGSSMVRNPQVLLSRISPDELPLKERQKLAQSSASESNTRRTRSSNATLKFTYEASEEKYEILSDTSIRRRRGGPKIDTEDQKVKAFVMKHIKSIPRTITCRRKGSHYYAESSVPHEEMYDLFLEECDKYNVTEHVPFEVYNEHAETVNRNFLKLSRKLPKKAIKKTGPRRAKRSKTDEDEESFEVTDYLEVGQDDAAVFNPDDVIMGNEDQSDDVVDAVATGRSAKKRAKKSATPKSGAKKVKKVKRTRAKKPKTVNDYSHFLDSSNADMSESYEQASADHEEIVEIRDDHSEMREESNDHRDEMNENREDVGENHEEASENHEDESENHEEMRDNHEETSEIREISENHDETSENYEEAGENHEEAGDNPEEISENYEETSENHEETSENHEETSENHEELSENREEIGEYREDISDNQEEIGENQEDIGENQEEIVENHEEIMENHEEIIENHEEIKEPDASQRNHDENIIGPSGSGFVEVENELFRCVKYNPDNLI